jgi:hypothetical protein
LSLHKKEILLNATLCIDNTAIKMHLYVEAVCHGLDRYAASCLLSGIEFTLLGGRLWLSLLACTLSILMLALSNRLDIAVYGIYALAGVFIGMGQRELVAACLRVHIEPLAWSRVPLLIVLSITSWWHINDTLCSNQFPLGLLTSFALYAALAMMLYYFWLPRSKKSDALHLMHALALLSIYTNFAWLYAQHPIVTSAATLTSFAASWLYAGYLQNHGQRLLNV